jgi:phosphate transport system substrate-binding protein
VARATRASPPRSSRTPAWLGYLNQAYVLLEQGFPQAQVINADGEPITATLEATQEGARWSLEIPDSFQFDILNIGGDGFPITGTAWVFAWECGLRRDRRGAA